MRSLIVLAALVCAAAWAQDGSTLFAQAVELEKAGKHQDAVKAYVDAARAGESKAARRLAEAYDKGELSLTRDFAQSLKWVNAARMLGEKMEGGWGCPPKCVK